MIPTFGTQAIHTCRKISFKPQTGLRKVLDLIWRCQSYNIRLCNYIFANDLYMLLNLENTKQKTHHTPGPSELRARHFSSCRMPPTLKNPWNSYSSSRYTWGNFVFRPGMSNDLKLVPNKRSLRQYNIFIIWHSDYSIFITINPAENIFKHI